jgi:CBS domain-containing protein
MAREIRDLMSQPPVCLSPDASIEEAARVMREQDIGDVFVADGDRIAGVVTDRDIVVRGIAEGKQPTTAKLAEVFTSGELVSVSPDDSVEEAITLMRQRALRRLPVVDDGRPVGVVSLGDLAIERDRDSALADISAAPPNN